MNFYQKDENRQSIHLDVEKEDGLDENNSTNMRKESTSPRFNFSNGFLH